MVSNNLQELVNETESSGGDERHDPETERQRGEGRVILVGDDGGDLGDGRGLLFLEDDRGAFDVELFLDELLFGDVFLLLFRHDGGEGLSNRGMWDLDAM